jgi:hypothetical protein
VRGILIILRESLANFGGRRAYHRVEIRIVVGLAPEDFDPKRPLFQFSRTARKGSLDDVSEKIRIPLAVLE